MKITFIRPYFKRNRYEPPLGVAILAGYLEDKGYNVSILDFEAEGVSSDKDIINNIKREDPDIVGVSFFTYDRFGAQRVANVAKDLGKIVIGGGVHITFDPVNTLNAIRGIDVGVLGEGEETLLELIQAIEEGRSFHDIKGIVYRKDAEVMVNETRPLIEDLNRIPMPAYHLLPMDKYPYHQILGSRGCPYNCIFCASPGFWRRKVRFRDYKLVVDEIEYLVEKYGKKEFDFKDDILFLDLEWTTNLCNELIKRKLDITWNCLGRVNTIDKALFELMRRAGCGTLRFGVESGNERVLGVINKKITLEQVKHAVKVAKEVSFEVGTLFMLGHPTETPDEMEETCQFAIELGAEHYSFKPADIYPGTRLFDLAVSEGLLEKDHNWFEKGKYAAGSFTYDDIPSYESANFSRELLEDKAKRFYLRSFFARIFSLRSISDFKLSRYRSGIGFIPASIRDFKMFVSEVYKEFRIKHSLKQWILGIVAANAYVFTKCVRGIHSRIKGA